MEDRTDVRAPLPLSQQWTLINAFGQRDLKAKFNGTFLGWVWSLVVPLATLGIYTLIFGGLFKMKIPGGASRYEGIQFVAVWLFAGLTLWGYFLSSVNGGISGLLGSGSLLQKVYFPAYAPVLGAGLAVGVQSLIEVGLLLTVFAFLGIFGWTWILIPFLFCLLVVFVQSVAVVLAIWNIHVRDLAQLVGVILQLMFFATPIIYSVTLVPAEKWGIPLQKIIGHMPMAEFIELFRSVAFYCAPGHWKAWLACAAWAGIAFLGAKLVYRRWGADLGERI